MLFDAAAHLVVIEILVALQPRKLVPELDNLNKTLDHKWADGAGTLQRKSTVMLVKSKGTEQRAPKTHCSVRMVHYLNVSILNNHQP